MFVTFMQKLSFGIQNQEFDLFITVSVSRGMDTFSFPTFTYPSPITLLYVGTDKIKIN